MKRVHWIGRQPYRSLRSATTKDSIGHRPELLFGLNFWPDNVTDSLEDNGWLQRLGASFWKASNREIDHSSYPTLSLFRYFDLMFTGQ